MKAHNVSTSFKISKKSELLDFVSLVSINGFIVLYFSIAVLWLWCNNLKTIKKDNAQSLKIMKRLSSVTSLTGLEQNWGLFCPNVRSDNHYSLAVITLQNDFLKLCEMPRIEKMDIWEKFQREKFRKIFNDNFPYPNLRHMRPSFSQFLTRVTYTKFNPPARISYFLISQPIQSPEKFPLESQSEKSDLHSEIINYFVYGVSPDDYQ